MSVVDAILEDKLKGSVISKWTPNISAEEVEIVARDFFLILDKTKDGYSYVDTFFGMPVTVCLNIKNKMLHSTVFLINLGNYYQLKEREELTTKLAQQFGLLLFDDYKKDCNSPSTLADWYYCFLGRRYYSVRWFSYKKDETVFIKWNRAYKNVEVGMSKPSASSVYS